MRRKRHKVRTLRDVGLELLAACVMATYYGAVGAFGRQVRFADTPWTIGAVYRTIYFRCGAVVTVWDYPRLAG
jgi:hypothetical protein